MCVMTLNLFGVSLIFPSVIFAAKTCTVNVAQSEIVYGTQAAISYSGSDSAGSATDLFLVRWKDGNKIEPPLALTESSYAGVYYYKVSSCTSGQSCQATTPIDFPPGQYYAFCAVQQTALPCSGNPLCSYEGTGGIQNCATGGYTSCSTTDQDFFNVKPSALNTFNVSATQIPTGLPLQFTSEGNRQTALLNGTWYIKPDRGNLPFQSISVPNFWRRWFLGSIWYSAAYFTDVFRTTPQIRDQMANPYPTYTGTVVYATKFTVPASLQDKTVRLKFGAISAQAEIFVNGQLVGRHLGIYDPFEFDIYPYITFAGENVLVVRVTDSSPYESPTYAIPSVWWTREQGGIWQNVTLTATGKGYLERVNISTPSLTSTTIDTKITNNETTAQTYTLSAQIKDKATGSIITTVDLPQSAVLAVGETKTIYNSILNLMTVRPWSPEFPNLYEVTIYLKKGGTTIDQLTQTVGFRTFTISADKKKFLLNERPYFLKGVNIARLQMNSPTLQSPQFVTDYLTLIKNAGVNTVRFVLSPPPPEILNETDRLGLLVLTDFATFAAPTSQVIDEFKQEIASWILNGAYTHPSLAIYAMGNENILFQPGNNSLRTQYDDIITYLKTSVDNTRVYLSDAGCMTFKSFRGSTFTGNIADLCGTKTDLTDIHWYYLWYSYNSIDPFTDTNATLNTLDDLRNAIDMALSAPADKPHLFTEYGGAYTDEQGNFFPIIEGDDPLGKPTKDSLLSQTFIGTNPVRPTDALNYQTKVINDTVPIYLSKRAETRLGGIFYNALDDMIYNPNAVPIDKIKPFYIAAYTPCLPNLPCITESTWQNHATLETKPAYTALKNQYSAISGYLDVICSLTLSQSRVTSGASVPLTVTAQGDIDQTTNVYLASWPTGELITPMPIGTQLVVSTQNYYKLGSCTPDGGACQFMTPSNLPTGDYYFMCDGANPKIGLCSGNPFCSYENLGGISICTNFSSCSQNDNALLTVQAKEDINGDGVINGLDLKELLKKYTQRGSAGFIPEDIFADGTDNMLDSGIIQKIIQAP